MRFFSLSRLGLIAGLASMALVPVAQADCNKKDVNMYKMGVAYQRSAEVEALQLQAYNSAHVQLDQILSRYKGKKMPAIVLDLGA